MKLWAYIKDREWMLELENADLPSYIVQPTWGEYSEPIPTGLEWNTPIEVVADRAEEMYPNADLAGGMEYVRQYQRGEHF